jgi:hypothetical protein
LYFLTTQLCISIHVSILLWLVGFGEGTISEILELISSWLRLIASGRVAHLQETPKTSEDGHPKEPEALYLVVSDATFRKIPLPPYPTDGREVRLPPHPLLPLLSNAQLHPIYWRSEPKIRRI